MPITYEFRCQAHGALEGPKLACPHGCPKSWVTQEFRSPIAIRRSGKMRFIDEQLKGIAKDAGLTDLKNDKAGGSVLDAMRSKTDPNQRSHWADVPHAKPGFSRTPGAEIPKVSAATFGTKPSAISEFYKNPPPPPCPNYVARWKG